MLLKIVHYGDKILREKARPVPAVTPELVRLAEDMVAFVEPLRQRILDIGADQQALQRIFDRGRDKARESAQRTLAEVRRVIGYRN